MTGIWYFCDHFLFTWACSPDIAPPVVRLAFWLVLRSSVHRPVVCFPRLFRLVSYILLSHAKLPNCGVVTQLWGFDAFAAELIILQFCIQRGQTKDPWRHLLRRIVIFVDDVATHISETSVLVKCLKRVSAPYNPHPSVFQALPALFNVANFNICLVSGVISCFLQRCQLCVCSQLSPILKKVIWIVDMILANMLFYNICM